MAWSFPSLRALSAPRVVAISAAVLLVVGFGRTAWTVGRQNLWRTPDQRGEKLAQQQRFDEAARQFSDPLRQGAAWFRAGSFEEAARAFGRVRTADGAFNRGNALVMLGKYESAVEAFDEALEKRRNWTPAVENREIARLRAERTRLEGGEMTGGMLGADEYVIEPGKGDSQGGDRETVDGGEPLSDAGLRALWLRRVQTKPADFLRAKFAFQLAAEPEDERDTEP